MYELALFAGAGGGILGGKLLGWRTVCAVEIDEYARRVLQARQDDGCLEPFPIWDDVRTFDGRPWSGVVDIITGGFPCQDISAAGKGAGIDGARSGLWGEMARIICEVGPRFVLVENSPMLTSRGLGRVVGDLAAMGYDARWGVLGAVDAGAPHKRERIWIVADACGTRRREDAGGAYANEGADAGRPPENNHVFGSVGSGGLSAANVANARVGRCGGSGGGEDEQPRGAEAECAGEDVADSSRDEQGRKKQRAERERTGASSEPEDAAYSNSSCGQQQTNEADASAGTRGGGDATSGTGWWITEPDVGRVAHGVAARVDRLRCLGNGQVSAVVRLAWRLLAPKE